MPEEAQLCILSLISRSEQRPAHIPRPRGLWLGSQFSLHFTLGHVKMYRPHQWRWKEGFRSASLMWKSEGARFAAGVKAKIARGQGISRERAEAHDVHTS